MGSKQAPFIFLRGCLEPGLGDALQIATMKQLQKQLGEPRLQEENRHNIADCHAIATHSGSNVHVFVPRGGGPGYSTAPCVQPLLMAFVCVFRQKNQPIFMTIAEMLTALGSDEAKIYARALREGRHFGIWEVQRFFGSKPGAPAWHIDGATSLLHLSVTLGGQRELLVEYNESGKSKVEAAKMSKGDVYLSSPFLFRHGVQHTQGAKFHEASMSIQMRLAFTNSSESKRMNHLRNNKVWEVTKVIASVLDGSSVQLPSLQEVQHELERLCPGR